MIYLNYNAKADSSAVVGTDGNTNSATVTYSSSINSPDVTSTTVPSTATVYLFKIKVEKTDQSGKALAGAEFSLTPVIGSAADAAQKAAAQAADAQPGQTADADNPAQFTFSGLGVGSYKLTETKTPAGYKTIAPITITISAVYDPTTGKLTSHTATASPTTYTLTEDSANPGTWTIEVKNTSSSSLPSTGSIGIILLSLTGVVLFGFGFGRYMKNQRSAGVNE